MRRNQQRRLKGSAGTVGGQSGVWWPRVKKVLLEREKGPLGEMQLISQVR